MSANFPFDLAMLFHHNNDASLIELTLRAGSIMNALSEPYWNDNTYGQDAMLHIVDDLAPAVPVTWYGIDASVSQGFKDEVDSFMAGNESPVLAAGNTANPGLTVAEQNSLRAIMTTQAVAEGTRGNLEALMAANNLVYASDV